MSAIVHIARDSWGVRLELNNQSDIAVLRELGPYDLLFEEREWLFMTRDKGNQTGCTISEQDGRSGLRFRFNTGSSIVTGRFSCHETEADIYNAAGFAIGIPPIHELPWPLLHENERYDVIAQVILCIAERALSMGQYSDTRDHSLLLRRLEVPHKIRTHLRGGAIREAVLERMGELVS